MPWYKNGTVKVTNKSNAILGTGTAFISNSRVGDAFRGPDGAWYEVINIASDIAMSIAPDYQGSTVANGVYALAPMQGYIKESADALRAATQVITSGVADMQEHVATATEAADSAGQSKATATEQAGIASAAAEKSANNKDAAQLAAQQSQGSAQASGAAASRAESARDSIINSERAAAASATAAKNSADRAEEVTRGKAAGGDNNDITSLRALTADGFDRLRQGIAPMVGSTATAAGKKGLVPAAAAGEQGKFLTGGGIYKDAGSGIPVGSLVPWSISRTTLPAGWIARDGQLLNRADWPDLWALVSASAVTDTVWLAAPYTSRGKYSNGDGATTFRMPDTNGKQGDGKTIAAMVLRGDGKSSAGMPGLHQVDALQNITASINFVGSQLASPLGAVATDTAGQSNTAGAGVASDQRMTFDASRVARTSTETRSANETVIWCTVGAGKAINPGSVDVTALATTVSNQSSAISTLQADMPLTPSSATFVNITAITTGYTLPAGGTWAWWTAPFLNNTAGLQGPSTAGVSAGGTTIRAAAAGVNYIGFAWRIS